VAQHSAHDGRAGSDVLQVAPLATGHALHCAVDGRQYRAERGIDRCCGGHPTSVLPCYDATVL
jgi:hypothetical protein